MRSKADDGISALGSTPRSGVGQARAFTLIELLVVVSIIALLIGLLLPALAHARRTARLAGCGSNLSQIGVGLTLYFNDAGEVLPQDGSNIAARFGGKAGWLTYPNMTVGADERPLNEYVTSKQLTEDSDMPLFLCPSDEGQDDPLFAIDSMYDAIGTSYTLNDHDLTAEEAWTLIPLEGGRMPYIADASKTWVIGDLPIYNYQEGQDRRQRWHHPKEVVVNLLFLDTHVGESIPVPDSMDHSTDAYTFWPVPDWDERRGALGP